MQKRRIKTRKSRVLGKIKNIILITITAVAMLATPISFVSIFWSRYPYKSYAVLMASLVWLVLFAYVNGDEI